MALRLQVQHTVAKPARFQGIGVHSGARVRVSIEAAPAGAGVSFLRTDVSDRDAVVPARAGLVSDTRLGTTLRNGDAVSVATVEHLMAALSTLDIDNAVVRIDGPETPIMDGSAQPFVLGLARAGRRPQPEPRAFIEVMETISVEEGEKSARLLPCDGFEMSFEIAFDDPAVGRQSLDLNLDDGAALTELVDARTFGFLPEVEALNAAGLARGGSLDNVVVVDAGRVLNPEGLRRPDEFVRHKMLDAVGDLALLGAPVLGRYEGRFAGHALNNALARALLAKPAAWRWTTRSAPLALAV